MQEKLDRLISPAETAQLLGVTVAALAIMRTRRKGPAYVKLGRRVKYSQAEIASFIARHVVEHSHSTDT